MRLPFLALFLGLCFSSPAFSQLVDLQQSGYSLWLGPASLGSNAEGSNSGRSNPYGSFLTIPQLQWEPFYDFNSSFNAATSRYPEIMATAQKVWENFVATTISNSNISGNSSSGNSSSNASSRKSNGNTGSNIADQRLSSTKDSYSNARPTIICRIDPTVFPYQEVWKKADAYSFRPLQNNTPNAPNANVTNGSANSAKFTLVAGSPTGLLYGVFHLIRTIKLNNNINTLFQPTTNESPAFQFRMLNHWDNLDRSVERGYAGQSLWNWHELPEIVEDRYEHYAMANASVGINATAITNVNANAAVLTRPYLEKAAALAKVFGNYGIRVFLTARFSAPMEIGKLPTADPLDPRVQEWWNKKVAEIYQLIPNFGGFLVKANSEGQPGPQNYSRSHADGANMMAKALAPFNGTVIWRAFVYASETKEDRFKQAFQEFQPLDGKFLDNVWIQVKNGPIDFQPEEPYHPLFGAMPKTKQMMEFQLTQEYLGFATHLAFLPQPFHDVLHQNILPSSSQQSKLYQNISGIAAVANTGAALNWTGHLLAQSNWYGLGRLAWNPQLQPKEIGNEWIRLTFGNDPQVTATLENMLMNSHRSLVQYMTPLGLHHIMGYGHHYGPAPWYDKAPRADWNPVYFHQANRDSIGFNRTATGSNALAQYPLHIQQQWNNPNTCPENFLLWFHRVGWNQKTSTGKTVWESLSSQYHEGVVGAEHLLKQWKELEPKINPALWNQVHQRLQVQYKEAKWWRDACLRYFQSLHQLPFFPSNYEPEHSLEYYQQLQFPFAPGNG